MLYVVATPIGNLGDLSPRAVEILHDVDFVVCEDTRHSGHLLSHFGIRKETVSLPAFAEGARADRILERLVAGQNAALVTDAGTPAISDPGEILVAQAIAAEVAVTSIPGPVAAVAALSVSGLPTSRFHFLGFLPRKGQSRTAMLEESARLSATLILYESPRRVCETLADLERAWGNRRACVARELTKMHEELLRGSLADIRERLEQRPEVLGELVVLVEGRTEAVRWTEDEVRKALAEGLVTGEKMKPLTTRIAQSAGWSGGDVYRLALSVKDAL